MSLHRVEHRLGLPQEPKSRQPRACASRRWVCQNFRKKPCQNYRNRHNCVLVLDPSETWANLRDGGRNAYANDGGQAGFRSWVVPTLDEWKRKREDFERGDVVAYEDRAEWMFVAGDATRAYSPKKLSSWVRQVVFLRPHAIVVFDRVVATRAEFRKTWLLHARREPGVVGAETTIADGGGRLVARTLLPEGARIEKVFGYAYGGTSFDVPRNALTDGAVRWRVEVSPLSPRAEDLFLHVLFRDEPQPTEVLRRGPAVGVRVGKDEVLFAGPVGGTLVLRGRSFLLEAAVKKGPHE